VVRRLRMLGAVRTLTVEAREDAVIAAQTARLLQQ